MRHPQRENNQLLKPPQQKKKNRDIGHHKNNLHSSLKLQIKEINGVIIIRKTFHIPQNNVTYYFLILSLKAKTLGFVNAFEACDEHIYKLSLHMRFGCRKPLRKIHSHAPLAQILKFSDFIQTLFFSPKYNLLRGETF